MKIKQNQIDIKDKLNYLIKVNSTDNEIFLLFKNLFKINPNDIDYLMLYSRFLGRTCYGRFKDKKYLMMSEKILYNVLKIHNNHKINNISLEFGKYQTYAWLAMIYGYYGMVKKANLFFKYSEKFITNKKEQVKLSERKSGILNKIGKYKEVILELSRFDYKLLTWRSIGYLAIAYYHLGDKENFIFFIKYYIQIFFKVHKYLVFILNKEGIVLSMQKLDKNILNEIEGTFLGIGYKKKYKIIDNLTFNILLFEKLDFILNQNYRIYGMEGMEKYIKHFLDEYK